ncbi:ABC transporter substrate-binding protein [Paenibacillus harenae]|uniref:ABC transporter substrate-binding protein n=1 Tax=Paenibacillus harenae TaxID=306543 RepID=UPI00278FB7F8|nr:sugar ABC transporter substrate-binding protein [Paenibacillus harenae]MDQ0058080.1 ABC-type glycerol-3-phosphate transport system substrate-binding protein [Paenibacillus harenae]
MKQRWKSSLFLLMAVILLLSACSSGSSNNNGGSGESKDEKVKLVVWIWDSAQIGLDLNMDAFKAENPNIEIEYQLMGQTDLYQKYLIAANTGDKVPDIIAVESSNLAQMVNIDSLYDLSDKVAPYKDKIVPFKWEDATKDGKVYAMPWDSGPVVMYYRKDIFEAAGLPSDPEAVADRIKTFEDYKEVGNIIKEKTGNSMFQDSKTRSNNRFFETMMWQRGLWYFDKDGNVSLDDPKVVETAEFYASMVKDGIVNDAEAFSESWLNAFADGKVATIVGAAWYEGLLENMIDPDSAGKWGVAPMPKWSVEDPYASANDGGSNLAINANSKHPEEAWKFIEFMLGNEESQVKMMKDAGSLPSLTTTYEDAVFSEPVEYFGGQPVRKVYTQALEQIAPQSYTVDFPVANQLTKNAFAEIFLNNASVADTLKKTADELRSRTSRK